MSSSKNSKSSEPEQKMKPVRLNNFMQVRRLLTSLINRVIADESNADRRDVLRCVTTAAQAILKTMEFEDLQEKLRKIEEVLNERQIRY